MHLKSSRQSLRQVRVLATGLLKIVNCCQPRLTDFVFSRQSDDIAYCKLRHRSKSLKEPVSGLRSLP